MTHRIISSVVIGLAALASFSAFAQESNASAASGTEQTAESVVESYAPGSITSTEIAERALEDVKRQRASVEARFAEDEVICYRKFFVTSCMDAAKDRRRRALKQLNTIEVEANAFNRRARVEEKDRALRERQTKQEATAAERADAGKSEGQQDIPATPQDIAEVENRARQATTAPAAEPAKNYNVERAARREGELKQQHEKDAAEAKKREENIRAYEKKQQRALERQREIAAKKLEKEQKREQAPAEKP